MPSRLLIADDSPLYRLRLSQIFSVSDRLQIVGIAGNGREAISLIKERRPDILLLDLEMPELDGFTVLRWTMKHAPVPVVVCSAQTGRDNVFEALEAGAIDFITKPQLRHAIRSEEFAAHLRSRVETAAESDITQRVADREPLDGVIEASQFAHRHAGSPRAKIVTIAGSTGSPAGLAHIVARLPMELASPIVIALHMPQGFTRSFADRLARSSKIDVSEAKSGEVISSHHIYVAPGGQHLTVNRGADGEPRFILTPSSQSDFYTPSADRLMISVAELFGRESLAIVLTGMGDDSLAGARAVKQAGGTVVIESRQSAVIWGMPRVVSEAGLADAELSQNGIATALQLVCQTENPRGSGEMGKGGHG
jgi:two-component system chemotaxis response regulator CheB